ncbi:MAG: acetylxylan esterase [Verrucomicrobiota bacterium]
MKTLLPILLILCGVASAEDLTCLSEKKRVASALYPQLQRQAYAALDERQVVLGKLETPEDIQVYQKRLREFFITSLGGFPEQGPLNAKTVGTIEMDGYRIEKVIYESVPGHHITANFYLPEGKGPFPAVVVSSGHSRTGKTADYNQRFAIIMAQHGMAALAFDPIGQGERSQNLDDKGQPAFKGTTTEHFLMGVGSILVGRSTARYRVWDAMRSIDYLVSRPEIDAKKIGMTGCSGGGTLTSYTMALDDRVACAAPSCYLTTFRRLIETIGPQDAEQNVFGQIAYGLDQPDYVILRAPRPTLISTTTSDFFDISGSWDNFRQAKAVYGRLGFPERVDLVENPGKHGVPKENLAMIAQWMQRWLLGRDEPVKAVDIPALPAEQLLCLDSGQVLLMKGERSVFDLNAQHEKELAYQREKLWKEMPKNEMVKRIREKVGMHPSNNRGALKHESVERVEREGYALEKLVLPGDDGVPLPVLIFHPTKPNGEACVYLHEDGKAAGAAAGGAIEKLVKEGMLVVSVDLRGQGETASGKRGEQLGDWKTYYLAYQLGRFLVGMRVEDTIEAAFFARFYKAEKGSERPVHLIASGPTGIVALHAAALSPEIFASVKLINSPSSWASIVGESNPVGQLDYTVHGALELYDLPDLVRLIGKDKVTYEK